MKRPRYMLPLLALALVPSTASANAGTPLMWASMFHLFVGNAMIGLVEGLLLSRIFKRSRGKSILILIAANYFSAWAGACFVAGNLPSLIDITIQNIQYWCLAFVFVAFVITLLAEFPFVWFALGPRERRLRATLKGTLAVNGMSYVVLVGWYWMASGTSMMSHLDVVSVDEMAVAEPYALYFISREGDQVLRMDLNDRSSAKPISEVVAHHRNDRLFVRPRDGSGFDLLVCLTSEARTETEALVLEDFSEQAPVDWRISEGHSKARKGSWFNVGPVPSLAAASDWEFRTGLWAVEGLRGEKGKAGDSVHFSLELPFAKWPVRNATHLSGDYVVTQLGDDQVCMIDPNSRRIALIARGKGPIVAKPKTQNKEVEPTATPVPLF